ncbi:MAG: hypothetical protein ACREIV_11075, partial [Planctomycetaceae bacterium]
MTHERQEWTTGQTPSTTVRRHASWRHRRAGRREFSPRRMRLLLAGAFGVGLLVLFALLVFWPFSQPDTHLVAVAQTELPADAAVPLVAPPAEFAAEDVASLRPLATVLAVEDGRRGPVLVEPAGLRDLSEQIESLGEDASDVLILYLSGHGVSLDGSAYLTWSLDPSAGRTGRISIDELLTRLTSRAAAVKLVVIDAGRIDSDPRTGMLINEFPRLLEEEVYATGDPALWVFVSNSPLETSFVSRALEQSVFAYFVSLGLRGAADLDRDGSINLDELNRYVTSNVSAWVRQMTAGNTSQTPRLLWGGGAELPANGWPELLPVGAEGRTARRQTPADSIAAAQETSRSNAFRQAAGLTILQPVRSRVPSTSQLVNASPTLSKAQRGLM